MRKTNKRTPGEKSMDIITRAGVQEQIRRGRKVERKREGNK